MAIAIGEAVAQLLVKASRHDNQRHAVVVARVESQDGVVGINHREVVAGERHGLHVVFAMRHTPMADGDDKTVRDVGLAIDGQPVDIVRHQHPALFYLVCKGLHRMGQGRLADVLVHSIFDFSPANISIILQTAKRNPTFRQLLCREGWPKAEAGPVGSLPMAFVRDTFWPKGEYPRPDRDSGPSRQGFCPVLTGIQKGCAEFSAGGGRPCGGRGKVL